MRSRDTPRLKPAKSKGDPATPKALRRIRVSPTPQEERGCENQPLLVLDPRVLLLKVDDPVLELGLLREGRRLVNLELRDGQAGVDRLLLLALDVALEILKLLIVEGQGGALLLQLGISRGVLFLQSRGEGRGQMVSLKILRELKTTRRTVRAASSASDWAFSSRRASRPASTSSTSAEAEARSLSICSGVRAESVKNES